MKSTPIKRRYTEEFVQELGDKLLVWMSVEENYWLGEFAVDNKMGRSRVQEIASRNPGFNLIYERAKQMQENKLVKGGMSGKLNTTMVIFSLKNVANWRDQRDVKHSGSINHSLKNLVEDARGLNRVAEEGISVT